MTRLAGRMAAGALIGLSLAPGAILLAGARPAAAQESHALPRRGDYLPQDVLRGGPIADYGSARLRKPPAGYGWYQLGRAYVMASVATGLIVEVVIL